MLLYNAFPAWVPQRMAPDPFLLSLLAASGSGMAPELIAAPLPSFLAAPGAGMAPELKRSIDTFIASNKVVVFMKGNREAPQVRYGTAHVCGEGRPFPSANAHTPLLSQHNIS